MFIVNKSTYHSGLNLPESGRLLTLCAHSYFGLLFALELALSDYLQPSGRVLSIVFILPPSKVYKDSVFIFNWTFVGICGRNQLESRGPDSNQYCLSEPPAKVNSALS